MTDGANRSEESDRHTDHEPWELHARWWQRQFTAGADPEYEEQILPLARSYLQESQRVLDIGTGEGQVARAAVEAGVPFVVGCDLSTAQIIEAARRAGGPRYLRAAAHCLPFAGSTFDAVVICLVLEHVDELEATIAEAARVLAPGGVFVLFLNHPLLQTPGSGWIDDQILDPPEQYWRVGPYLEETATVEEVERGIHIRFIHRPLSRYVNAMARCGLLVERMDEPPPPPGFLARAPEYPAAASIPRLLLLVARRHA
ncbi:MAG: class I SAM-dependent methyltransferase [Acidimicrobiales bacterium]|nr:class I SAM-dependent methyltransferase [Acidimicrobiales bacterium]